MSRGQKIKSNFISEILCICIFAKSILYLCAAANLEKKHMELFLFLSSHNEQSHEEGQQSPGLLMMMMMTPEIMMLMAIMMTTRSLARGPLGPDFYLEALRASWLCPSRPPGAQAM